MNLNSMKDCLEILIESKNGVLINSGECYLMKESWDNESLIKMYNLNSGEFIFNFYFNIGDDMKNYIFKKNNIIYDSKLIRLQHTPNNFNNEVTIKDNKNNSTHTITYPLPVEELFQLSTILHGIEYLKSYNVLIELCTKYEIWDIGVKFKSGIKLEDDFFNLIADM